MFLRLSTPYRISIQLFFMLTDQIAFFRTHRNDRCGFPEIEIYHPNSPENWQNPSFYVGIMPTIIFPGMELEDGGGG